MTLAFEVEERFESGPETVWAALTDWERAPRWMPGIDAMRAEGPTRAGTRVVFEARGKTRKSEITHLVEGRELTLTSRQGPVTAAYRYRCEPDAAGTRVALLAHCEIRGPLRLLGPLLRRLIAKSDAGQLRALRALLESG